MIKQPDRLVLFLTIILFATAASGEVYQMSRSQGGVSASDLRNLGAALGVRTEMLDYSIEKEHCIQLSVEIRKDNSSSEVHKHGVLCSGAGPHRLTVQVRENKGTIDLHFFLDQLDSEFMVSVGGMKFNIGVYRGTSGRTITPVLELFERHVLFQVAYGFDEPELNIEFMVLGELRPNPEGILGTG